MSKNFKPIIIVAGEPNSVFLELCLKFLKKIKNPLILIVSEKNFIKTKSLPETKIKIKKIRSDK